VPAIKNSRNVNPCESASLWIRPNSSQWPDSSSQWWVDLVTSQRTSDRKPTNFL